MKIVFEEPKISVKTFAVEDVITTSGGSPWDEDELPPVPNA